MSWHAYALLLVLALASGARAQGKQGAEEYRPPAWPESPGAVELGGRLGLMALLTAGVAGAVIWWARRLPSAAEAEGGAVPISVVEQVSLGGGCSLHLLQVDQEHFVVGIDSSGLKVMHALARPFDQILEEGGEDDALPSLQFPVGQAPAPSEARRPA